MVDFKKTTGNDIVIICIAVKLRFDEMVHLRRDEAENRKRLTSDPPLLSSFRGLTPALHPFLVITTNTDFLLIVIGDKWASLKRFGVPCNKQFGTAGYNWSKLNY